MSAPLTVVIPTLNSAQSLPGCVAPLYEGIFAGLIRELIVTDGGSHDDTTQIAEALGARVLTGPAGRGGQLSRGTAMVESPWVLVLHADTQLSHGWADRVYQHMAQHPSKAGYFWLRFDATGMAAAIVARWANLRSALFGLPYGDQGFLVPRKALAAKGGYPDLPLMEDVALAKQFRGALCPLGAIAVTSAERYLSEGWLRRGSRNLTLLLRYLSGADPKKLAAAYLPKV
ncbi:MAG: TIGR04283 family arsenosugar biosynthesis glycosyltransferase [Pseudomonadota bacterium]